MTTLPSLTLTYFDVPGRGETIRAVLTLAGVPFDDERLSPSQFTSLKASFPYGLVPVLTVDGETLAETQPILRYVGRLTGMYPPTTEPIACALVDEILDSFDDLFQRILTPSLEETDRDKSSAMRAELVTSRLPQALGRIDKRLVALGTDPFFASHSTKVFIHDILTYGYHAYLTAELSDHLPPSFMDAFPAVQAACTKVAANASIRQSFPPLAVELTSPRPQKLTLTYFDMAGRAEPIRLALHIGGAAFTDERASYGQYLAMKASLPNGNFPVLNVDGLVLAQSAAILRYAGTIAGLYPATNPLAAAKVDEVLSHLSELYYAIDPWFAETDATKKQCLAKELAATTLKESLGSLDKRLATWKASPCAIGGDAMTIADLAIYVLLQFLQTDFVGDHKLSAQLTGAFTQLTQIHGAVAAHPRVVDWIAQRAASIA